MTHPVLLDLGFFKIYTYGFFVAIAMTAAFILISRLAPRLGHSKSALYDLVLVMFVTGVIGARAAYVLQNADLYLDDPSQVFWLKEGGLVWYGGFVLAAISSLAYAWVKGLRVPRTADLFAPVLAAGHAIGRIGCFFNGCCYGVEAGGRRLPVQLFESLFLFFLFLVLLSMLLRKHRDGAVFLTYLLAYSAWRFGIEFLRADQAMLGSLTIPQWVSIVLFVGSLISFFLIRVRDGKR